MNNLFMEMINALGFQLIPGFWALFLLSGLFQPDRLERARAKRGASFRKNQIVAKVTLKS